MTQRPRSLSVLQATLETPSLARLSELVKESGERLKIIAPLIPLHLRSTVHPGPIDGPSWCLILDNNASASKIRQLLPELAAHLRSKGREVTSIRLRIQMPGR
jgi:hypothetical protein